jgi:hypothetical protein
MDVSELRTAFNLSSNIAQRIEAFRRERIDRISQDDTPVPIQKGCKMVFHIIPISAFCNTNYLDIKNHRNRLRNILTIRGHLHESRFNLEGLLNISNAEEFSAYVQIHRNSIFESVFVCTENYKGMKYIPKRYEKDIIEHVERCLGTLTEIDVHGPYYMFLSFVGAHGFAFAYNSMNIYSPRLAGRDIINIPGIEIPETDADTQFADLLRPIFDMFWNAFNFPASENYDANGKFKL